VSIFTRRRARAASAGTGPVEVGAPPRSLGVRWTEIDAADTPNHPDLMDRIEHRRHDGVTITGVFTADECAVAVERLERFHDRRMPSMFGTMLGLPLANLAALTDDPEDRSLYYEDAARCREYYAEAFGFDPHDRVAEVLQPMCGGLEVAYPTDGEHAYSAGNIRWYEPGMGHLKAHAGNEFKTHSDAVSAQLRSTTRTIDHFSWFVVLQPPDEGGALSVYDLLFETHSPADPDYGEQGRDDSDFDDQPHIKVSPEAGGMVFFGGGWRWHRVDPIVGSRPRITYGGFAGPSTDGRSLNLWF